MSIVQITGTKLVRDTKSMALVNTDANGLEDYKMKRRMLETQREEINKVKSEMDCIKNDLAEIKQLMIQLLGKDING